MAKVKAKRVIVDNGTEVRIGATFESTEVFPQWTAVDLLKNEQRGLISIAEADRPKVVKEYETMLKKGK